MKLRTTVICKYNNPKISAAVANALGPDNLAHLPGLKINTVQERNKVVTEIEIDGKIETLVNTLDDLLACTQAAESVLGERDA